VIGKLRPDDAKQGDCFMRIRVFAMMTIFAAAGLMLQAADLEPLHESCAIGNGDRAGMLRLEISEGDCRGQRNCGNHNMSDVSANRFTGISLAELANNGAHLTATLTAEAGTLTCAGTVSADELQGNAVFTPDHGFIERMEKLGFSGYDTDKLLAYALLNVQSEWAQSLKQAGVPEMDADNLLALRIFNVDPAYVKSITALGYPMPTADQLVAMACQGVNADEVRQIRALGYQPDFDQLVQIRIFKVTPEFIHRMQARGFKDLTLEKLVQIRIFKLAD
jgi:hypothetical protein